VTCIEIVAERVTTELVHIDGDCLVSERTPSHTYAQVRVGMARDFAHRVVWIAKHGPIPEDLTIDHICCNTRCVNIEHLRLMTRARNGYLGSPHRATCIRGHSMHDAYVTAKGHQRCRQCAHIFYLRARARRA
jgi:hypothetical protein